MKKISIILIIILSFQAFSQNHKKTFVFEFDQKTDVIVYRQNTKTQKISGFTFMINGKKIFFSSSPLTDTAKLKINTSREELNTIMKNDNANNEYHFFVYVKDKRKYYSVDHIFRTIACE